MQEERQLVPAYAALRSAHVSAFKAAPAFRDRAPPFGGTRGRCRVKVEPRPSSLRASMRPP
jgi:hypothetical protein